MTDKPKDDQTPALLTDSMENLEELGKGNNALLPLFENNPPIKSNKRIAESVNENTKCELQNAENVQDCESETKSHMVMHKGALIDVEKLLLQLNRSEKAREETEHRLEEITKNHNELQLSNTKAKDKIKDLQSELKSSNRKINDVESSLSNANVNIFILIFQLTEFMNIIWKKFNFQKKCSDYYSILCGIHDKVTPVFAKSERNTSKKESSK